jgi:hypothetical protein
MTIENKSNEKNKLLGEWMVKNYAGKVQFRGKWSGGNVSFPNFDAKKFTFWVKIDEVFGGDFRRMELADAKRLIEGYVRGQEFAEVDEERKGSYFDAVGSDKRDNVVIRLEKAIVAIGKSLYNKTCYRKCVVDGVDKPVKVRVGKTTIWFVEDPWNKCWYFVGSGFLIWLCHLLLTLVSSGRIKKEIKGGIKKLLKSGLKRELKRDHLMAAAVDVGTIATDRIIDAIDKESSSGGFFERKDLDASIKRIEKRFDRGSTEININGLGIVSDINGYFKRVLDILDSLTGRCLDGAEVSREKAERMRQLKLLGNFQKVVTKVLKAASGMEVFLSELPYVYNLTDMLFFTAKDGETTYRSQTKNVTRTKFAVYAAIVEDMVNKRILGWKLDKYGNFESKVEFTAGFDKYFRELNISAAEIAEAVEILDMDENKDIGGLVWSVGKIDEMNTVKEETITAVKAVQIKKNVYGSLHVAGKGMMQDFGPTKTEDQTWVYSAKKDLIVYGSVENIGAFAFNGCSKLRSVTIREGVRSIGKYAFFGCATLETITIPKTVVEIGYDAFGGCKNLKYVVVISEYSNGYFKGLDKRFDKDAFSSGIHPSACLFVHKLVRSDFERLWGEVFKENIKNLEEWGTA